MAFPHPNLIQVLKLANIVETGGQAKALVDSGAVKVNGEVELRKRRQLVITDQVSVENGPLLSFKPMDSH